jgi:hypothetical protein
MPQATGSEKEKDKKRGCFLEGGREGERGGQWDGMDMDTARRTSREDEREGGRERDKGRKETGERGVGTTDKAKARRGESDRRVIKLTSLRLLSSLSCSSTSAKKSLKQPCKVRPVCSEPLCCRFENAFLGCLYSDRPKSCSPPC